MRIIRIYQPVIGVGRVTLSIDASHHLIHVLRLEIGADFVVFDGLGKQYPAKIIAVEQKKVIADLEAHTVSHTTSPLQLHLGQVISRGEKMDYTIQKAVELGVSTITPLFSERCNVKLAPDRLQKKLSHWQKIIISACEQCGQDTLPKLNDACTLQTWLPQIPETTRYILAPDSKEHLHNETEAPTSIALLVGSEGGFTDLEISQAVSLGFKSVQLGPRILRTETAALVAMTILQFRFGDI